MLSQPVSLQPAVQGAAAETQGFGRLADVAIEARHRLLDEEAFDFLEAHVLDSRALIAIDAEPELAEPDDRALRHQHAAFNGVIELADVARPRVVEQRLHCRRLEPRDVLAIALRVLFEEMSSERRNVLA